MIHKIVGDVPARREKETRKGKGKGFAVRADDIETISYIAKAKSRAFRQDKDIEHTCTAKRLTGTRL